MKLISNFFDTRIFQDYRPMIQKQKNKMFNIHKKLTHTQ